MCTEKCNKKKKINVSKSLQASMADNKEIDESLYSRQLYIIDHASMRRVMASNVLIIGLGGLGVETGLHVLFPFCKIMISDSILQQRM